jgi:uncharacterized protein
MVTMEILRSKASAIHGLVARYPHLARPRVFGSVARGEASEQSDVDILVDALPGATLLDIGGLLIDLEELLQARVDLMTPGDFPPNVRAEVLNEAEPL